jgi:hypothetical protein
VICNNKHRSLNINSCDDRQENDFLKKYNSTCSSDRKLTAVHLEQSLCTTSRVQ